MLPFEHVWELSKIKKEPRAYSCSKQTSKIMTKQLEKLTDSQWKIISHIFTKRKRKLDLREVLNAILCLVRSGIQWRNFPLEFP
ncbi:MAG: transposase [Microscillaceae bacterium]|nr:transposase [Microscillaceae bacterium]